MKLTKGWFGSYFDALQFGYTIYIYTLSWKDEKLKRYSIPLVCLIEDADKFYISSFRSRRLLLRAFLFIMLITRTLINQNI